MIPCMRFPEFGAKYCFPEFEAAVLKFWKDKRIFERLLATKAKRKSFGFYDGPPFATGTPHYGHLLAGSIKDIVPRYWTMRGYHCERRFGWDTHGLPVEYEIEKSLQLNGSLAIREYGIDKFNEACRGIVLRYTSEWRETVERMGRWVDLDNDYKTMDPDFMESIWWVFRQLWDKRLIYQGKKVVPYSWRITAPLSNFEAGLNYKSVQDPAISVLFPLTENPAEAFVAWTTTPWTLPANLALTVNPELEYVKVPLKSPLGQIRHVWLAKARTEDYAKEIDLAVVECRKGKELAGKTYEPLFPFFADRKDKGAFRVLTGDFVSETDGTGFVHTAPAFGEDDYYAAQRAGIELVDPTNEAAEFTDLAPPYKGKFVKDADKDIIKDLKQAGRLLRQATIQHNYPYCYRSDTPLIYKAISSWFVKVEAFRDRMVMHNQLIRWVPGHLRDGRFGKWLENARDWCISRNRFWGTPIPVWICTSCDHRHVVASREELAKLAGREVNDLHSHFIDDIRWKCAKCGTAQGMKRTPEVLDCWFESGSMPYAQAHYPFENIETFEETFPADFIAEGLDQTRGWFYTLMVLSTALFDKPAFRTCVVNGMVLAEDGKKMSKSLKNYPDPKKILDEFGADALRLYFLQSPGMHGDELRFSEKQLIEHMRAVMLPLWNAYGFFASYANIDGFQPELAAEAPALKERPRIDRWIKALLCETEEAIHETMERYEIAPVAGHLSRFVDNLTNWYIRLNRSRFWEEKQGGKFSPDKLAAYATLWETLESFSRVLAPFLPFFAESLHAALHFGIEPGALAASNVKSVHEALFDMHRRLTKSDEPLLNLHLPQTEIDKMEESSLSDGERELIREMAIAQRVILLGRSLRAEAKIGLRQPLARMHLAGVSAKEQHYLEELGDLVRRELNVKEIDFAADPAKLVIETVKPNLPRLGPRLGKKMGVVTGRLKNWTAKEIAAFEKSGRTEIEGEELTREDILIERKAQPGKCAGALEGVVAELDTTLTPALLLEGLEREIVNRIQQRRKADGLRLTDRIQIEWCGEGAIAEILERETKAPAYISGEVLALRWQKVPVENWGTRPASEELPHGAATVKFGFVVAKAK